MFEKGNSTEDTKMENSCRITVTPLDVISTRHSSSCLRLQPEKLAYQPGNVSNCPCTKTPRGPEASALLCVTCLVVILFTALHICLGICTTRAKHTVSLYFKAGAASLPNLEHCLVSKSPAVFWRTLISNVTLYVYSSHLNIGLCLITSLKLK